MVIICPDIYNKEPSNELLEILKNFPYPLYSFQKYSIEATLNGYNSLVCAHTGAGKSICATATFPHFIKKGLKIIYTTPIKSLSNQKYYDFKKTFPNYSIGLITGDIKVGPNSDIIIMTQEILKNALFNNKYFDIDFNKDIGLVVMDEVHYINDRSRGHAWEQAIMSLAKIPTISLIMLSATINKPEIFAKWVSDVCFKEIALTTTKHRTIPLKHYAKIVLSDHNLKSFLLTIKDPSLKSTISSKFSENMLSFLLKDGPESFNDHNYHLLNKILDQINSCKIFVSKTFVLNEISLNLKNNNLLPAIFFSLSRKNVEYYSGQISNVLFNEDESYKINNVSKECRKIMTRLPNYKEYIDLPEYSKIVSLLEKGICYHHSGMLSIYRELIELMFELGYVKFLFATETFAVGINLPTKTVLFDSFTKFDGLERRLLKASEFAQMSGRAGRLGLDTVGHVIHLSNLFRDIPSINEYKEIMTGSPQTFSSKFKIDGSLVLSLISRGLNLSEISKFIEDSMIKTDIDNECKVIQEDILRITEEISKLTSARPLSDGLLENYATVINNKFTNNVNKFTNKNQKILKSILQKDPDIAKKYQDFLQRGLLTDKLESLKNDLIYTQNYIQETVSLLLDVLIEHGFIISNKISERGLMALAIQEANGLAFADILVDHLEDLDKLSEIELTMLLSVFCIADKESEDTLVSLDDVLDKDFEIFNEIIKLFQEKYLKYDDIYLRLKIPLSDSHKISIKMLGFIRDWCLATDVLSCKSVINDNEIQLGSLTKVILKINNLALEISGSFADDRYNSLRHKLSKIPELTLKFMITNQSLYL